MSAQWMLWQKNGDLLSTMANVLGNVRLGLTCGLRDNNRTCHLFLQREVGQGRQAEAKKMSPKKDLREVVQICTV